MRRSRIPTMAGVIESTPKTRKIRVVDLDPGTLEVLKALRTKQREARQVVELNDAQGYLFTVKDDQPIDPNLVTRTFRAAVAKAGLRHIPLHGLRHTHASLAIAAGVPIPVVSKRLVTPTRRSR